MKEQSIQIVSRGADFVTLSEAKDHLVVTEPEHDVQITVMIASARLYAEKYTGRFFSNTEMQLVQNGFGSCIHLPHKPVSAIVSVIYDTDDAQSQTLAAENYELDARHGLLREAYDVTFPTARSHWNSVRINYTVGYDSVPEDVKSACLLLIGDLFENREAQQGFQLHGNKAVHMLLNKYRVWS